MEKKTNSKKKSILDDHKKVGKRFVPPFVYRLADKGINLEATKWVDVAFPEILWIGLLHAEHGVKNGTDIALKLAQTSVKAHGKMPFYAIGYYNSLNQSQKKEVVDSLKKQNTLELIKKGLVLLITIYPDCPLNFLFETKQPILENYNDRINAFQETCTLLMNKREKEAMLLQASAIYVAALIGVLHLPNGSLIKSLNLLQEYPESDKACEVASVVRATASMLFMSLESPACGVWNKYFWKQGLKIIPCNLKQIWRYYER